MRVEVCTVCTEASANEGTRVCPDEQHSHFRLHCKCLNIALV